MAEQDFSSLKDSEIYRKAMRIIYRYGEKRKKFEDRDVLERIIIPYILETIDPKKILDVGREEYEHFYNLFFKERELWTIDINPEKAKFGSENHIIDDVKNVTDHFNYDYFGDDNNKKKGGAEGGPGKFIL